MMIDIVDIGCSVLILPKDILTGQADYSFRSDGPQHEIACILVWPRSAFNDSVLLAKCAPVDWKLKGLVSLIGCLSNRGFVS